MVAMSIIWQIARLIVGCIGWVVTIPARRRYAQWRFHWALRRKGLSSEEAEILAERYCEHVGLREIFRSLRTDG